MSMRTDAQRDAGELLRGANARLKTAIHGRKTTYSGLAVRRKLYPALMIAGVYRMSFAMGLAVYALPTCGASISNGITRHRARLKVRDASWAFRQTFTHARATTNHERTMCPAASGGDGKRRGRQE